jgi:hypothetical protein
MMDGKAGKAVRSEIHSLQARGVNSTVWVQERAGHEGQGISSRLECPVNLSQVLAPVVRYCRIRTTPCVERKDLLGSRPQGFPLPRSPLRSLAGMSSVFYRMVQAMREGESFWSDYL